jgi:hypothetical protein
MERVAVEVAGAGGNRASDSLIRISAVAPVVRRIPKKNKLACFNIRFLRRQEKPIGQLEV